MKHLIWCVTAAAAWVLPAAGDVVSLGASADNTLYEYVPEDLESPLSNGGGQYLFIGNTNGDRSRRALIRFDIAGSVPPGATITSVTLRLNVSRTNSGDSSVAIHRLTAGWGEGTVMAPGNEGGGGEATAGSATWVHRVFPGDTWATRGGDFSPAPSDTFVLGPDGPFAASGAGLAADCQAWLDGVASNFGWCLVGPEDNFGTAKRVDSREYVNPATRPTLTIEFTPAPGCVGDYNQDGGVDGADVEAFFIDWENGDSGADLNQDGGVDGGDVEFFFTAWESGC